MNRADGRKPDELRPVKITKDFLTQAEGSALIELGNTKVICTASVDNKVPPWLEGRNKGWVTAEYAMIPRATTTRTTRDRGMKIGGRTQEIQRLIGRSMRCIVDLKKIPDRTVVVDADVISADGGTRTAAITGCYVALYLAFKKLVEKGELESVPITDDLAATSVGIVNSDVLLDLNYAEDSQASVDMNIVMTGQGNFVEVQATGEKASFSKDDLNKLLDTAGKGIKQLIDIQKKVLL